MDPGPETDALRPLMQQINEALSLESKFQPQLSLPKTSPDNHDVSVGVRDGTAHVLRCLKVWYDLPSDVLFVAANLMDRFLTKMKVRPKHMACISVAAFQLACQIVCGGAAPDPTDVLAISQCKCTLGDLNRMEGVISTKLGASKDIPPITPIIFLRIFDSILKTVDVDQVYERASGECEMWHRLEVVACDAACSNFRPSEVALVLLSIQIDTGVASLKPAPSSPSVLSLISCLSQLQQHCHISENEFYSCHSTVLGIISRYNAEAQLPHRQRLVWKVSNRTMKQLRPTERLVNTLPTIDEHGQLQIPPRHHKSTNLRDFWANEE